MKNSFDKTSLNLVNFLMDHPNMDEVKRVFGEDVDILSMFLTEEIGVRYIEPGCSSILYVTKGRIVLCDLDFSCDDVYDQIEMNTFLLGAGEPYHTKPENGVMLFACKGECELFVFNFKDPADLESPKNVEVSREIEIRFRQAATNLDDYYFGYDERYAKVYEAGAELWESDKPNESLLSMINKHRYLLEGRIIDLGCGEGRDSIYLAQQGCHVTGVDVSRAALNKARERARKLNLTNLVFVETDVIYLRSMTSNFYDVALNMGCLHMLTDERHRSKHIQRVYDMLKPGGYFLVDHCQENWGKGFYSIPDYKKVANDLVPGKSIARRIRIDGGEDEIDLEVLPYSERRKDELINEISTCGFQVVDMNVSDTEAFGNSVILLFRKP